MKTIQLIAAAGVFIIFAACSDSNKPVQTATENPESTPMQQTPGSTPAQVDSVKGNPNGPDQMVPENSSLTTAPKNK